MRCHASILSGRKSTREHARVYAHKQTCVHNPVPRAQECGSPDALLNVPWSIFNKLVDDTGPQSSAQLRRMAAEGPDDEPPHVNYGP